MLTELENMVEQFDRGQMSRRQLVTRLGGLLAAAAAAQRVSAAAQTQSSTFQAVALNHIALNVTDVARSRDFYRQHLGLNVRRESRGNNCFLGCGEHFVALFQDAKPGLDHYCYTIPEYEPGKVVEKLNAAELKPRRAGNRVYFDDPDGITVQIAAKNHGP